MARRKSTASTTLSTAGYTLIEIVIVATIMVLMIGGGLAALLQFQEKQEVVGAVAELKVLLRSAQSRARSGDKPEGCERLLSYAIRTVEGTNQVQMIAVCDNQEFERKEGVFSDGSITAEDTYDIRFITLKGGVEGATAVQLQSNDRAYVFNVTQGGEITEGAFVEE